MLCEYINKAFDLHEKSLQKENIENEELIYSEKAINKARKIRDRASGNNKLSSISKN